MPSKAPTESALKAQKPAKQADKQKQRPPTSSASDTASKTLKRKQVDADLASISRPRPGKPSKARKAKTPSPEPSSEGEEQGQDEVEEDDEEVSDDEVLHGFSTDEDSSDEDDAMDDEDVSIDTEKLPTVARDDASVKRKLEKAKRQPTEDRGVLYLSRMPHGFYEDQMKAYFSQFGNVTRLRLARNKKTGKSKHYGFIEFDSSSVAKIVSETMDNYLLMGHILRCKVIPKDDVHPELWVGANRKWRMVPRDRIERVNHNKPRTEQQKTRAEKRLLKRQEERKQKLAELGIKYNMDAVGYKKTSKAEA